MNVLSLFDGISCGQVALERAGIKVDKYFACEIKPEAIQVTQHNYPNTLQLGDVTKISSKDLPKIDLLIGGSPCQGFSNAGKMLNFEDPRSKLFFEYVRLLKELKPKYFLLENVRMKQEWQDIISEHLGVYPIRINSRLVSAQLRDRYYWTNIPCTKPKDRRIMLQDILEGGG
jgi:DNA (cytosine-5)-methyltransferase 3A